MRPHRQRHDPSKSLVGFLIGDIRYAVPIRVVREIANPLPIVSLPHSPPEILGVANYRGEVIPVLDMRSRFGLKPAPASRKSKWIVVGPATSPAESGQPSGLAALAVDAVTDVFGTGGAKLSPAPPLGGGEERRGIAGVTSFDGDMVFVLDTLAFSEAASSAVALAAAERAPALLRGPT
jgi:purine-binding chemotaxis protein CheW